MTQNGRPKPTTSTSPDAITSRIKGTDRKPPVTINGTP